MEQTSRELDWQIQNFAAFQDAVKAHIYPHSIPFELLVTSGPQAIPFADLPQCDFRSIQEGEQWAENWESAWFKLKAVVPEAWAEHSVEFGECVARLNFGGEACIMDAQGEPIQGLTGGSVQLPPFERELYRISQEIQAGEEIELLIEAAANELWGIPSGKILVTATGDQTTLTTGPIGIIKQAKLAIFDEAMYQLWIDLEVLIRLHNDLPKDDPQRARLTIALDKASAAFRYDQPNAPQIREILAPMFQLKASGAEPSTSCIGHAHIDTAWLWPMKETIRKCGRTFSNQLRLMERYPEYQFGASQVPHYLFTKEHYPKLYEDIKASVRSGRWEIQGALWVECDCNVPSGESLSRQLLYGKRFFQQEFGIDVKNAWLPDVFGFTASLPQILKSAGVDYFVTQKLSWSRINRFPHHTFHWSGIDGSKVLCHMLPLENYNAQLFPDLNRQAARQHNEKGFMHEFLTCFGIGDGGGGPNEQHIEYGLRQQDLAGCPKVSFGKAQDLLERLDPLKKDFSTWDGPLYLERHQGTLTTHLKMKQRNRRLEDRLRFSEIILNQAGLMTPAHQAVITSAWQTLLLMQFHDILPGSSISSVYEDAHADYDSIENDLDHLPLFQKNSSPINSSRSNSSRSINSDTVWVNTCPVDYNGVVTREGQAEQWLHCPAMGSQSVDHDENHPPQHMGSVTSADHFLENDQIRYEFNTNGQIISIFDKEEQRELCPEQALGNTLSLYQDHLSDAWDSDTQYRQQCLEQACAHKVERLAESPLCHHLVFSGSIGRSSYVQKISLSLHSKRLDIDTKIDWQERLKMLRVAFPLELKAREASVEIQWGVQKIPLHENTSWERGLSDIPGHRFADISERDYGCALLNDSHYAYYLKGQTIEMNLLRSSNYPDPEADRGEHHFRYALLPHNNDLEHSSVFDEARWFNGALFTSPIPLNLPFNMSSSDLQLETLKAWEDGEGLILRLCEVKGRRTQTTIQLKSKEASLCEVDLIERSPQAIALHDQQAQLHFKPFEFKTLLIRTKD